jgi:hypothetical protein
MVDPNTNNETVDPTAERSPRRPSQRQITANQNNARRSTGPRTDAGKRASSENATKTGVWATQPRAIRRGAFAEDDTEIASYVDELVAALDPRDAVEREQASVVATQYLRLRRLANLEPIVLGAAGRPSANTTIDHARAVTNAENNLCLLRQLDHFEDDADSEKIDYETATRYLRTTSGYLPWAEIEDKPSSAADWQGAFERTCAYLWKDSNTKRQWIDAKVQYFEHELHRLDGALDEYLASQALAALQRVAETDQRLGRQLERSINQYRALRERRVANAEESVDGIDVSGANRPNGNGLLRNEPNCKKNES